MHETNTTHVLRGFDGIAIIDVGLETHQKDGGRYDEERGISIGEQLVQSQRGH